LRHPGILIRLRGIEGNKIEYTLDVMSNRTAEAVFDLQGNLRRNVRQELSPVGWDKLANPSI
jgi:hypothetical protein